MAQGTQRGAKIEPRLGAEAGARLGAEAGARLGAEAGARLGAEADLCLRIDGHETMLPGTGAGFNRAREPVDKAVDKYRDVLASCYRRSPQVADELGARTVAFPAIATGVYGFPPEQAARIAVATIRSTPTAVQRVRLVAFDDDTRTYLQAVMTATR
ncbi:macro domain-containing protein [Salinispora mooreana]|uniref:macro domain-containing protein n=1 Tax=Salinispora mooreana TaxID=999545 RepID=UPI00036470B1|nr:macro domain-containing protein [Salinispora mooreana]